eukprot:1976687-Pleurochrysis_carterae.AAC.1
MQRRAEMQRTGALPPGAQHAAPRYIQVYIDDFSGVSLDDRVSPPEAVAGVVIDAAHTAAAGGTPAPPDARTHTRAARGPGTCRAWIARSAGQGSRRRPGGGPGHERGPRRGKAALSRGQARPPARSNSRAPGRAGKECAGTMAAGPIRGGQTRQPRAGPARAETSASRRIRRVAPGGRGGSGRRPTAG